jgi:hypothetical protein
LPRSGIEPPRIYDFEDARTFLADQGVDANAITSIVADKFIGAFVRATKPAGCRAAKLLLGKDVMAGAVHGHSK